MIARAKPLLVMLVLPACGHGAPAEPSRAAPPPLPERQATESPPSEPAAPPLELPCNEQPPRPFLMRHTYISDPQASPDERKQRILRHQEAIAYRTREYGHVEGFGDPRLNPLEPKHYAVDGSFFGVGVKMNVRVLTALECVEKTIQRRCDEPYQPRVLDGLRMRNTFYNGEVSNHTYGIAIDIDPGQNPCCGCLPPLRDWQLCKEEAASPYERTRIPRCWVESFERFGFYWLGHDQLEDTMHFEFLGDPDIILKAAPRGERSKGRRPASPPAG